MPLAYHFAQAATVTDPDKVVHYALLAGEQALAAYAWEKAREYFERGLETKEGQPVDAQSAALLFGLARAQMATAKRHELVQAAPSLKLAYEYYADAGDVERAVETAAYPYTPIPGRSIGVTHLIVHCLGLVPPESHQAGRLLSRYGYLLAIEEGDYVGAQEAVAKALSIAERERDSILEMETLANAARVDRYYRDFKEGLRKSLRATELARHHDSPCVEVAALHEAAIVSRETGELNQSRQHAVAMLIVAERLRDRFWLASAHNFNANLCYLIGDWQAGRQFSDRGLARSVAWRPTQPLRSGCC